MKENSSTKKNLLIPIKKHFNLIRRVNCRTFILCKCISFRHTAFQNKWFVLLCRFLMWILIFYSFFFISRKQAIKISVADSCGRHSVESKWMPSICIQLPLSYRIYRDKNTTEWDPTKKILNLITLLSDGAVSLDKSSRFVHHAHIPKTYYSN